MAVTYPRDMICGVTAGEMELARYVVQNRLLGGVTQVREVGEARWVGKFTYSSLKRAQHQEIQAWLDSLRGGLNTFYAYDPLKPNLVSYPGGVLPLSWNGLATVSSVSGNSLSFSTGGVPIIIKPGDMVGLIEGAKRGLFRVIEGGSYVSGSGSLIMEPRVIPGQFTTGATANFRKPTCIMTLDPGSVNASRTAGSPGSVSFSGIQKIY